MCSHVKFVYGTACHGEMEKDALHVIYVYIYIHVHIHICINMYMCVYIYIDIYICVCIYTYIHINVPRCRLSCQGALYYKKLLVKIGP